MVRIGKCLVCGMSIDVAVALNNTNRPDCCDYCAIYRREEYRRKEKEK